MSKTKFVSGFRDGIPIALGYLAVSFGLGISCRAASLTPFQGFLLSLLNNASAGEYGGITIMAADEGFLVMAAMMLVINARYLLMSCALSQHLSPNTPLGFRLLIGFDMTDELFGIAIAQPGYLNVWYFIGAMCATIPGWSFGTLLGVLCGNLMPQWAVSGFSVMLFGMFLAIIIPEGRKNRVILGFIGVSFLLSYAAAKLPLVCQLSDGMRILLLTVAISSAAAILFPHKEETVQA
ncbi:MAG: AzlC family ABC transporter permease [Eubacteriales bacterium]|nr:AzlC family ABC transporter permease [Eubacteriales bacterium]